MYGGRGGQRNNGYRSNSYPGGGFGNSQQTLDRANAFSNSNLVRVEIQGWQGASPQDLASFLSRKVKIIISNLQPNVPQNGVLTATVRDMKDAQALEKCTGLRFAGDALRIKLANGNTGSGQTSRTIELLKTFLNQRFNPQTKMLDLTNMVNDPMLVQNGLLSNSTTSSKFFAALMKLAKQDGLSIESVNLSDNNMDDYNKWLADLAVSFPHLKNLAIGNNNIRKQEFFARLKNKFPQLHELILMGNPISNNPDNMTAVVDAFPHLVVLNGQQVRDEVKLTALLHFPILSKSMFFETEELSKVAANFIATYLNMWDNDRLNLLQLYTPDSQFSYQVDTTHLGDAPTPTSQNWSNYLSHSRNLKRVSGIRPRMSKLCTGTDAIGKAFQALPKTKTSIHEHPEWYSVETTSFPALNGMQITVHGEFNETAKPDHPFESARNTGPRYNKHSSNNNKAHLEKRSFDRTFIVIPGPSGNFIVASDMLLLKPFAGNSAFIDKKQIGVATPAVCAGAGACAPAAGPGIVTPSTLPNAPGAAMAPIVIPPGTFPPDIAARLTPSQQQLAVRIMNETRLNLQFTLMLCEQSNWDYQAAGQNFANSKAQIPPNAYQQ